MTDVAKLILDGDELELPVVVGTEDETGRRHHEAPRPRRATSRSTTAT